MVEVQGVCLVDTFVIALQEVVVVRAEEEHERHDGLRLLDRDGEGPLEVARADVAATFAFGLEGELIILEARSRSDQYGAEVLVLEGHPAQRLLDIFVGFAGRLEAVYIALRVVVVDTAILSLELPGLLLLGDALTPLDILQRNIDGEEATKLVTADGEVHAVVGAAELIYVVEVS